MIHINDDSGQPKKCRVCDRLIDSGEPFFNENRTLTSNILCVRCYKRKMKEEGRKIELPGSL